MKAKNPDEAWAALNSKVCDYIANEFDTKGFRVRGGETTVDQYTVANLETIIEETVRMSINKHISESESNAGGSVAGTTPATPSVSERQELSTLIAKMKELISILSSTIAKTTGKEVIERPKTSTATAGFNIPTGHQPLLVRTERDTERKITSRRGFDLSKLKEI